MTENEQIIRENLTECSTNICSKLNITKKEIALDDFPVEISKIEFEPHSYDHLTFEEAYEKYRLSSWAKMPQITKENELYALFHVPKEGSSLLSIKITTKSGGVTQCRFFGVKEDGTINITKTILVQNGNNELEITDEGVRNNDVSIIIPEDGSTPETPPATEYESQWGPLTENNMAQCFIQFAMRGTKLDTITGIEIQQASKKPTPEGFKCWNIVELVGWCPELETLKLGNFVGNYSENYRSLSKLRFVKFYGSTKLKDLTRAFNGCSSLIAVDIPCDQTTGVTSLKETFKNCSSLVSVKLGIMENNPSIDMQGTFNNCTNLDYVDFTATTIKPSILKQTFYGCKNLMHLPENLDTSEVTDMDFFACNCTNLTEVPFYNLSSIVHLSNAFSSCKNLLSMFKMNIEKVQDMSNTFANCVNLIVFPELYAPECYNLLSCFSGCTSLNRIGNITVANGASVSSMFYDCVSLTKIPSINSVLGSYNNVFGNCYSLISIPKLKLNNVNTYLFQNCNALSCVNDLEIKGFDVQRTAGKTLKFLGCYCLAKLTFAPTCDEFNFNLDFTDCTLGEYGIVDLFESLPNTSNGSSLILTNNRGYNQIDESKKQIAINKGWNLVY